jgi:asparagine synthase (glutamine-hydrolysing)
LFVHDGTHLVCATLHTTKESHAENQPYIAPSGYVFMWDGRLDNREDLIGELCMRKETDFTDVSIVAGAYEKWGNKAFAKLLGDWALSIWNPIERSVMLAKDFLGLRRLYYTASGSILRWCTLLEPLLLLEQHEFELSDEYLAGWFAAFPGANLTPYRDILSVPPGAFVTAHHGSVRICQHWSFDSKKQIRYARDAEYEEHFRDVFTRSVARRLRSDRPVLAELSGGVDSSSIVCVADRLSSRSPGIFQRLDTLSYYHDGEPNWQERAYFGRVEEQRGRGGLHIDLASASPLTLSPVEGLVALPGDIRENHPAANSFRAHLRAEGHRVVLSGIGGDEVTGGKPTPIPELADLFARAQFRQFVHQLYRWSLYQKKPWVHVCTEVLREFLPRSLRRARSCAPWVDSGLRRRQSRALNGYRSRFRFFEGLPSFQENLMTLDVLSRQLASEPLPSDPPYERRFPFLDRDLLEFLYSIPREQFVRPGQRRSLLRRALRGIVPEEILNRRRKSFVARTPSVFISEEWDRVCELTTNMVASSLGLVSQMAVSSECKRARHGLEVPMATLLRTLAIECWLRSARGAARPDGTPIVSLAVVPGEQRHQDLATKQVQLAD